MRPTRDQVNMQIAMLQAERGKCERLKCGCVVTKEGRIVSSGYNGSIIHNQSCSQLKCDTTNKCEHSAHAEQNAIAYAAKEGISLNGSTVYVTTAPCYTCARLLVQAGIAEVVYKDDYITDGYSDLRGILLLCQSGVIVREYKATKNLLINE